MSITKKPSPPKAARRTRRSPEAARANILAAAQALLLEKGPQALKLTDVAARAGIAHATVLHHFGTIADVHAALMERMIGDLVGQIQAAHAQSGKGGMPDETLPATGAPLLFDAFEQTGAARLAAWLELTGEARRHTLVRDAVRSVLAGRKDRSPGRDSEGELAAAYDRVLLSIVLAVGVGLFGRSLAEALGRPPGRARELAQQLLKGE